jgi:hypothetical protein
MSITLTTGKTVAINGVTVETNPVSAVIGYALDLIANILTVYLATGTLVSGNLSSSTYADRVTLVLNLTNGVWSSSNGFSGTIAGAALANFVASVKANRNQMEVFCAGGAGIAPGVQVPWT